MEFEFIRYEKRDRIAYVTINRPEVMNALHPPAHEELARVWDDVVTDPEIWVAINIRLVNPSSRDVVAQTSFERRQRAAVNDVPGIVSAFDEAVGGVMKEIVIWTVTNPALSEKRG